MPAVNLGGVSRIAIVGGSNTRTLAPYEDRTWTIWAHASACLVVPRATCWFDLHRPAVWREPKPWHPHYLGWLRHLRQPIYMQDQYPLVPRSIRYPRAAVESAFPGAPFTSTFAWMMGLALAGGVSQISVFGCDFPLRDEYWYQRPGALWWIGLARGRGVEVTVYGELEQGAWVYGYDARPDSAPRIDEHVTTD